MYFLSVFLFQSIVLLLNILNVTQLKLKLLLASFYNQENRHSFQKSQIGHFSHCKHIVQH